MIISRSPLLRPPFLEQQCVVVGHEGAPLRPAGAPAAEEDVGHEAGLGLDIEDARAQVLGQVLRARARGSGRSAVHRGFSFKCGTAWRAAAHTGHRAASSSACVPCSTTRPASIATTRSACSMVDRRCAMTSVVRPCISPSSASCTARSTFAVQRRRGFVQDQHRRVLVDRARDRQPLALTARELAAVVADQRCPGPAAGRRRSRAGARPQRGAHTLAVDASAPSATLAGTVSLNSTTSWLTSANWRRSAPMSHSRSGTPSSRTRPVRGLQKARQQIAPASTCPRPRARPARPFRRQRRAASRRPGPVAVSSR